MKLAGWLTAFVFITLLAGAGLTAILFFYNPFETGWLVFLLFYACLFIGSLGIFTLAGLFFRRLIRIKKKFSYEQFVYYLKNSFRQAFLLSLILVALLFLQAQDLLFWWNLLGLVLAMGLIDWYLALRTD